MSATLAAAAARAAHAIPPLWPLAANVAVNPFLGQADQTLGQTAARLARVAGQAITMPRAWFRAQISRGVITDDDLAAALAAAPDALRPPDLGALKAAITLDPPPPQALPTMADLAAQISGFDWPGLIAERFGFWAADYFDEGQALWAAPHGRSAYTAWRHMATHDLTPEILGLEGFALFVSEAPDTPLDAMARISTRLKLPDSAQDTYFHQLLMSLGGWAQYARYRLWQAELAGGTDETVTGLLAIRLLWEEALFLRYEAELAASWAEIAAAHAAPAAPTPDHALDAILQDAAERAAQRALAAVLAAPSTAIASPPALQMAFCIDVRSEIFRRALESINPAIQTIGFAGFFGVGVAHRRFGSDVEERRLPVLLNPPLRSCAGLPASEADGAKRIKERAKRAWGRFKLAAVSSFAFVEAMGPVYAAKLLADELQLGHAEAPDNPAPYFTPAPALDTQITAAETALRGMSLTRNFAPLVLIAGHGASVVNNPHASALQCGACGGYAGDVNARLLASLLNDPAVRAGLGQRGIAIPTATLFTAALHDTTTDDVTLYPPDDLTPAHLLALDQARAWLAEAGALTRGERALRLPNAGSAAGLRRRARDWAETRPEWGLAGCQSFIAAPRALTAGKTLQGRAFLHDYDWRQDDDFAVLELILTAPVIVASWINLQYYGSTVAPEIFGAGNKLLHNVTGGIGVVEGNGGLLRTGLPWQSVHDGARYMHDPLRLSVYLAAPVEAMTNVLERHASIRNLADQRWLHLIALDDHGHPAGRYAGGLAWTAF